MSLIFISEKLIHKNKMNPRTTPKDFFLHLGAAIALYVSAIALLNLSFSVIDYFLPDRLAGYFYAGSVAWPISMLIVLVPLLYIFEWMVGRDLSMMPEKKELWIRKWRTYLTLFLAGAAIIGDLIALINIYLNGEITGRFVYKVLAVLVVSAVIFVYYILEKSTETMKTARKTLAWLGIVIVIAGIIGGFAAVGSPSKQRNLRFDNQRTSDLSNIQWRIISYWQSKESLPATIEDLNDPLSNFIVPTDPTDDSRYEYVKKGDMTFELCASFALPSEDLKYRGANGTSGSISVPMPTRDYYPVGPDKNDTWSHEAGKVCFERTIDPERYSPNRPVPMKPI